MSKKNIDCKGRWRDITIAFRVSQRENDLLNKLVLLTGHTKQDYLTSNMLKKEIIVMGNPKVYKALKDQMEEIYHELQRIKSAEDINDDLIEVMKMTFKIYREMGREQDD